MKILLAEDDRIISRGLEVFLSNNKHEIITVDNGEDALKQILRFRGKCNSGYEARCI